MFFSSLFLTMCFFHNFFLVSFFSHLSLFSIFFSTATRRQIHTRYCKYLLVWNCYWEPWKSSQHMMLPNNRLIFTTIHLSVIVCLNVVIKSIEASSPSSSSSSSYDDEKFTILPRNENNYLTEMSGADEAVTQNGSKSSTLFDHPSSMTTSSRVPNDSSEAENSIETTAAVVNFNINLMNDTNDFEISYPNDVDCSEFTEQKLMNIVICSTEYINNASSNLNQSDVWNSSKITFGDEFNTTNIPNDTSTTIDEIEFESTAYLVQVVTTSVILGIIILATVIGKLTRKTSLSTQQEITAQPTNSTHTHTLSHPYPINQNANSLFPLITNPFRRKCVCYSSNSAREESTKCCKLSRKSKVQHRKERKKTFHTQALKPSKPHR